MSKRKSRRKDEIELSDMIEELLNKINELFSRLTTPSRDPSDIVVVLVLLWLWLLSQSRTQFPQLPQYPITIPPPKRQFTVSEIEQMIKQCERSANPLECIKNMLYGG